MDTDYSNEPTPRNVQAVLNALQQLEFQVTAIRTIPVPALSVARAMPHNEAVQLQRALRNMQFERASTIIFQMMAGLRLTARDIAIAVINRDNEIRNELIESLSPNADLNINTSQTSSTPPT